MSACVVTFRLYYFQVFIEAKNLQSPLTHLGLLGHSAVANQVLSWNQSTCDATLKRDFPTNVVGPGVVPSPNEIRRGVGLWELGRTRDTGTNETIVLTHMALLPLTPTYGLKPHHVLQHNHAYMHKQLFSIKYRRIQTSFLQTSQTNEPRKKEHQEI